VACQIKRHVVVSVRSGSTLADQRRSVTLSSAKSLGVCVSRPDRLYASGAMRHSGEPPAQERELQASPPTACALFTHSFGSGLRPRRCPNTTQPVAAMRRRTQDHLLGAGLVSAEG
jgi:hypothetical protein